VIAVTVLAGKHCSGPIRRKNGFAAIGLRSVDCRRYSAVRAAPNGPRAPTSTPGGNSGNEGYWDSLRHPSAHSSSRNAAMWALQAIEFVAEVTASRQDFGVRHCSARLLPLSLCLHSNPESRYSQASVANSIWGKSRLVAQTSVGNAVYETRTVSNWTRD
jgi:hypothetical protein